MSGLMNQRQEVLLDEGIYENQEELNSHKQFFSNNKIFNDKKNQLNISDHLLNENMHSLELSNWLNSLRNKD